MIQTLFNNKNQVGLIALSPLLLLVTSVNDGLSTGLIALILILILTSILYFISSFIPSQHRLVSVLIISITVVLVARMILNSEMYFVADKIGLFLPLLVINSLMLSLGEGVFSKQDFKSSVAHIFGIGVMILISFILIGFLKELLDMFSIIESPAGVLMLLGLLFATFNLLNSNKVTD